MRKIALFILFLSMHAQGVLHSMPYRLAYGAYTATCNNCIFDQEHDTLTCDCANNDGYVASATLHNVSQTTHDIINKNGTLHASINDLSVYLPGGSYLDTCTHCIHEQKGQGDYTLTCECLDDYGRHIKTSLNAKRHFDTYCVPNSTYNDNGQLKCILNLQYY